MAAFARQHGYAPPRLYWWKKQLGGDERRSATATPTSTLALVPARVTSEAVVAIRVRGEISIEIVDATPSWVAAVVAELARSLP